MIEPTDDRVVHAATGDESALRLLLSEYGPAIRTDIARDIASKWQSVLDADDVMQVTYFEAFLEIKSLRARDERGFRSWLYRLAKDNLRDAIKGLQRQKRPQPEQRVAPQSMEDSCCLLLDQLGITTTTPSRHAARSESAQLLDRALKRLPEDYRTVIRLYDLQEQSVDAVARALGRSAGAVYMLRARAHERLQRILGAETAFFSDSP